MHLFRFAAVKRGFETCNHQGKLLWGFSLMWAGKASWRALQRLSWPAVVIMYTPQYLISIATVGYMPLVLPYRE